MKATNAVILAAISLLAAYIFCRSRVGEFRVSAKVVHFDGSLLSCSDGQPFLSTPDGHIFSLSEAGDLIDITESSEDTKNVSAAIRGLPASERLISLSRGGTAISLITDRRIIASVNGAVSVREIGLGFGHSFAYNLENKTKYIIRFQSPIWRIDNPSVVSCESGECSPHPWTDVSDEVAEIIGTDDPESIAFRFVARGHSVRITEVEESVRYERSAFGGSRIFVFDFGHLPEGIWQRLVDEGGPTPDKITGTCASDAKISVLYDDVNGDNLSYLYIINI